MPGSGVNRLALSEVEKSSKIKGKDLSGKLTKAFKVKGSQKAV
jgi:hypothetical protein